jgi:hypothetical protein
VAETKSLVIKLGEVAAALSDGNIPGVEEVPGGTDLDSRKQVQAAFSLLELAGLDVAVQVGVLEKTEQGLKTMLDHRDNPNGKTPVPNETIVYEDPDRGLRIFLPAFVHALSDATRPQLNEFSGNGNGSRLG